MFSESLDLYRYKATWAHVNKRIMNHESIASIKWKSLGRGRDWKMINLDTCIRWISCRNIKCFWDCDGSEREKEKLKAKFKEVRLKNGHRRILYAILM